MMQSHHMSHCEVGVYTVTADCIFGFDALASFPESFEEHNRRMHDALPSADVVFGQAVNGD